MKTIYYFNIIYACNSKCVFCFSHNTKHNCTTHRSIPISNFKSYVQSRELSPFDRVIINGGEPLLHPQIIEILSLLCKIGCEVLIYTNGRLLSQFDFSYLTDKFRFIVPIHGDNLTHDNITHIKGSYYETIQGLIHLSKYKVLIDIKIIINSLMLTDHKIIEIMAEDILKIRNLNSIHLTTMAETRVSKKNNVSPVDRSYSSFLTGKIFNLLFQRVNSIKLFDTCILEIPVVNYVDSIDHRTVFFKDNEYEWEYVIEKHAGCSKICKFAYCCHSAVKDFTVLEYSNGKFFRNLE